MTTTPETTTPETTTPETTTPQTTTNTQRPPRRLTWALLIAAAVLLVLAACAAGPNSASSAGAGLAGFWQGLWHGLISPVTFVISLFNDNVNVYEVRNNGNWYDAGFMGGVSSIFSSSGRGVASGRRASRGRPARGPKDAA